MMSYVFGAVVGLIGGFVGSKIGLPYVLRAQEAQVSKGKIKDPERTRRSTIFTYTYIFPVVFAIVFALSAHQIFN